MNFSARAARTSGASGEAEPSERDVSARSFVSGVGASSAIGRRDSAAGADTAAEAGALGDAGGSAVAAIGRARGAVGGATAAIRGGAASFFRGAASSSKSCTPARVTLALFPSTAAFATGCRFAEDDKEDRESSRDTSTFGEVAFGEATFGEAAFGEAAVGEATLGEAPPPRLAPKAPSAPGAESFAAVSLSANRSAKLPPKSDRSLDVSLIACAAAARLRCWPDDGFAVAAGAIGRAPRDVAAGGRSTEGEADFNSRGPPVASADFRADARAGTSDGARMSSATLRASPTAGDVAEPSRAGVAPGAGATDVGAAASRGAVTLVWSDKGCRASRKIVSRTNKKTAAAAKVPSVGKAQGRVHKDNRRFHRPSCCGGRLAGTPPVGDTEVADAVVVAVAVAVAVTAAAAGPARASSRA